MQSSLPNAPCSCIPIVRVASTFSAWLNQQFLAVAVPPVSQTDHYRYGSDFPAPHVIQWSIGTVQVEVRFELIKTIISLIAAFVSVEKVTVAFLVEIAF